MNINTVEKVLIKISKLLIGIKAVSVKRYDISPVSGERVVDYFHEFPLQ